MKRSSWCLVILISAAFLCGVVFSDQIILAHTGGAFGQSSREPKFKIEFHSEESPFYPSLVLKIHLAFPRAHDTKAVVEKSRGDETALFLLSDTQLDDDQESIVMPNKNGEKFICYLPKVEKSKKGKSVPQQNISSMIVESETRVKLKTPDELLEVLKGGGCFIRQEGWWLYELCHLHQLRQIHVEDEKVVQEYILGVYDKEATDAKNQNLSDVSILKDPRSKDASQRYHAHIFNNGTLCDLTNEPRETEVRFVCSEPRAMISSITELSTCKYALTFQCPTLCKHPLFHEERPVSHNIHCNALPNEERKAEDDASQGGKITIVTDSGYSPAFSSEEYAT